ncbi:MAG: apolipoprotein N-acyltransferase [Micromonosporaceae bacterium]
MVVRAWPAAAAIAGGLLLTTAFPPAGFWPAAPLAVALITFAIWRAGPDGPLGGPRLRGTSTAGKATAGQATAGQATGGQATGGQATGGDATDGTAPARNPRPLRTGAVLGLLAGAAFFTVLLFWLHVIGPDAWLILAVAEALYFVPLGLGIAAVRKLPWAPLWAACLWVAEEAIRGRWPLGGFTWGRLAFSQSASPLTRYASLGGAPLLTFAVALAGSLLAALAVWTWPGRAVTDPGGPDRTESTAAQSARARTAKRLAAAAGVLALAAAGPAIPLPRPNGHPLTTAVIQGNVPRLGLGFLGQRATVLHDHVNAVHRLAALVRAGRLPHPDLVILPENSSDIDPYQDPAAYALINSAVQDVGVPTLVGVLTFTRDGQHLQNRGIVWSPGTGPGAYYVKRHPVPFGEYVPMRSVLDKYIKRLRFVPYDQVAGHRPGVLRLGQVTIGDVICFEVAYDSIVRDAVTHGGRVIVVQTNNADYGQTDQPAQQLAVSRLRAVEHARPVLIAATSGISAIVTADGQVLTQSRQFTEAILVRQIRSSTTLTIADRLGEIPEWILTAAGTGAAIFGIMALATRDRTRRRQEV